jgi:hypothetical protein
MPENRSQMKIPGVYGVDEFKEFMKDAVCGILMALRTLRGWILA